MKKSHYITIFSLFIGALVLMGCPPKKKLVIEDQPKEEELEVVDEAAEEATTAAKENEIEISQDWTEIPTLGVINFDYDSSKLTAAQRAILKQNVGIIKKLPKSIVVRVAGHCDDRGTIEYNIALGQRRANTIRSYYKTAGIRVKRIKTISYGEERPVCIDQTEECWMKNRRAVTQVRSPESITVNTDSFQ